MGKPIQRGRDARRPRIDDSLSVRDLCGQTRTNAFGGPALVAPGLSSGLSPRELGAIGTWPTYALRVHLRQLLGPEISSTLHPWQGSMHQGAFSSVSAKGCSKGLICLLLRAWCPASARRCEWVLPWDILIVRLRRVSTGPRHKPVAEITRIATQANGLLGSGRPRLATRLARQACRQALCCTRRWFHRPDGGIAHPPSEAGRPVRAVSVLAT